MIPRVFHQIWINRNNLVLTLLTVLIGYVYVSVILRSSLDEAVIGTLRYNFGDQRYNPSELQSLNRWTTIIFWIQQQGWYDPLGFLSEMAWGSSYTSEVSMAGHLGLKYLHYGINLTAASELFWDTGLIGFMIFVSIFIAAWIAAARLRRSVSDPTFKADALAIQAAISLFLLSMVYLEYIVNLVSMELIYAIVLGYLGHLMNHHGLLGKQPSSASSFKQNA